MARITSGKRVRARSHGGCKIGNSKVGGSKFSSIENALKVASSPYKARYTFHLLPTDQNWPTDPPGTAQAQHLGARLVACIYFVHLFPIVRSSMRKRNQM
jgi:hypothetical protein